MIEWALAGARSSAGSQTTAWTLDHVTFNESIPFPDEQPITVQATVEAERDAYRVHCFGRTAGQPSGQWTEHVTVAAATPTTPPRPAAIGLDDLRARMTEQDTETVYQRSSRAGIEYGPAFRGLRRLWHHLDESLALVEVAEAEADGDAYLLHPVVLEACFHAVSAFVNEKDDDDHLWLPSAVDRISVYDRLPAHVWCHALWHGVQVSGDWSVDLELLSDSGERLVTIEGLRFRSVPRTALASLAGSRLRSYEVAWQPAAGRPSRTAVGSPTGTWLVFSADPDLARDWQAQLEALGTPSIALVTGPGTLGVDPDSETDVERFFAAARADGIRVGGLILHGGPPVVGQDEERDELPDHTYRLARRTFTLLKHFLRAYATDRPDVVVCSTGASVVRPQQDSPDLAQSVLTAMTKAVISEYPDLKCVQVDLDPAASAPPVRDLLERVADLPGVGHLAQRGDGWYEASLRESNLPGGTAAAAIRPDATYLVTGGLGGLGLASASWLADRGARSLLLVGRTVPAEEPASVTALRASGVRVELLQADMADPASVDEVLGYARRELPPLRGIVHAAGVTADSIMEDLDWARFSQVIDPKIRGAWHLHRRTTDLELDFFVLFSTMASLLGSPGQSNYITANAFLDALAEHRRHHGHTALSISWGPWAEVGMAARSGLLDRHASRGLDGIPTDQALDAFGQLLATSSPHVGLARVDWRRSASAAMGRQPYTLLAGLLPTGPAALEPTGPGQADELARLVLEEPDTVRETLLVELLNRVAPLLGMTASDRDKLRPAFRHTRLNELGLDSLTTVQLRNRLLIDFSTDVPPDLLFGGGTATDVVEVICQQLTLRNVLAIDDEGEVDDGEVEVLTL
jgi:NAD(P)-dependent dehydrogenase (short-subunit alcohol dehydrogenase family)